MATKKAETESTEQPKRQGVGGNHYLLDANGVIRLVDTKRAAQLRKDGWQDATEEQIAEWLSVKHQRANGVYYIVNPAGAIHGVDRDHARVRLAAPGWRLAEEAEIVAYLTRREQRSDRPICTPWSPDPDKQLAELE